MSNNNLTKVKEKFLHSDGFLFTLLRSGASSQICGWVDTIVSFAVFAFLNLTPWLSTAIGAFIGGVLNCIINYRFTFHAKGVDWRAAITKFMFVWAGSLLLNSFGTQIIYSLTYDWHWLKSVIGLGDDAIFLLARLSVSLIVSLAWNFLLQRNFVFKQTPVDKYIIRSLDFFGIGGKNRL